jgi:hypothetical protein
MSVDELGGILFGRKLRLRVASWVLSKSEETFYLSEAAEGAGYSASGVRAELERLESLGMVMRFPYSGSGRLYYQRLDSPFWKIIRAADDALREAEQAGSETLGEQVSGALPDRGGDR